MAQILMDLSNSIPIRVVCSLTTVLLIILFIMLSRSIETNSYKAGRDKGLRTLFMIGTITYSFGMGALFGILGMVMGWGLFILVCATLVDDLIVFTEDEESIVV